MKTLILATLLVAAPLSAQWTDKGSNTVLTTAAASPGISGPIQNCPHAGSPYCSGSGPSSTYTFANVVPAEWNSWGGGGLDFVHNLMFSTGEGHTDGSGNQIHAFDIAGSKIWQVTDPSNFDSLAQVNTDGTSGARHSRQLAYMPNENAFFLWGFAILTNPQHVTNGWWINEGSAPLTTPPTWTQKSALPFSEAASTTVILDTTRYPTSESLFVQADASGNGIMWRYTPATDTYALVANGNAQWVAEGNCAIDVTHKVMICAGGYPGFGQAAGVYSVDVTNDTTASAGTTNITSSLTGCSGMYVNVGQGLTWDSDDGEFYSYPGSGNSLIKFDYPSLTCTTVTPSGTGPTVNSLTNGTIGGRFQFVPSVHQILVASDPTQDIFMVNVGGCNLASSTLPNGTIGSPYSQQIPTTGCASPAFAVTAGSLPTSTFLTNLTTTASANGLGYSTFTCVDRDGDGYGTGPGLFRPRF